MNNSIFEPVCQVQSYLNQQPLMDTMSTMPDKEEKRGGARPGSGPKPMPEYGAYLTKRLDVRLTEADYHHITQAAAALNISTAEYLRRLIERDREG